MFVAVSPFMEPLTMSHFTSTAITFLFFEAPTLEEATQASHREQE